MSTTQEINKLQMQGRVIWIGEMVSGIGMNQNPWTKMNFLIEYNDGKYNFSAGFIAWGNAASIAERMRIGDWVTISFKPETRTHENKFFTDLKAYHIHIHYGKQNQVQTINTDIDVE